MCELLEELRVVLRSRQSRSEEHLKRIWSEVDFADSVEAAEGSTNSFLFLPINERRAANVSDDETLSAAKD